MTQPRKRTAASTSSASTSSGKRSSSATRSTKRTVDAASDDSAPRNGRKLSPARVARLAAEQLTEIMGAEADSISGLERTDDGWLVRVEVVEVRRIPDSTSVMACYQVMVDDAGELQSYRRDHRYYRNQAGDS